MEIYIDADACPIKEDTLRVAKRYNLKVFVVSNSPKRLPNETWIEEIIVSKDFDAADNWIAEHAKKDDIVITNDLLLAGRCVKNEARVIDPRGKILDEDNIGDALSTRELMSELRQRGELGLGPKKMGKSHRSAFLSGLDNLINAILKQRR